MNPAWPDASGIAAGYERLVMNLTRWAGPQANVRAALIRQLAPADKTDRTN